MSFSKHNWQSGEVITAEKLNAIEEGIESKSTSEMTLEGYVAPTGQANAVAATDTINEAIRKLQGQINNIDTSGGGGSGGMSSDAIDALIALLEKVAYIDGNAQQYIQDLEDALNGRTLLSITAVFTQGGATIYDTDSLDDLKQYLVVTANYSDGTTRTVEDYTLSGTLTAGTSTITATWQGKSDTFDVEVSEVQSGWVNNVYSMTSADLIQGGIKSASPYYYDSGTSYANRVSYIRTDVDLSSAYTYKIEYTTTLGGATQTAVRELKASGYAKVQTNASLTSSTDITDSGWQSSGYTFSASDGSYLWFTFHLTTNANITPSDFPTVTITRTAV